MPPDHRNRANVSNVRQQQRHTPIIRFVFLSLLFSAGSPPSASYAQKATTTPPAASAPSANYDLALFSAELQTLSQTLAAKPSTDRIAEIRDSLPKQWVISTPDGNYTVDTQPLRNQLTKLSATDAKLWIDNLSDEIKKPTTDNAADTQPARAQLDEILKRKEFAAVGPPGAMELLRARIAAWVARLLFSLFSAMGRHPIAGESLFWLLLLGGVAAIAVLLFRFLAARDRLRPLPATSPLGISRTWQEWLFAAREAAKRGDFREAVRCAYWAGIVRLEDTGAVPKDRSKTPREYLRLATQNASAAFGSPHSQNKFLADLTARLERVWYAKGEARAEDFQESLRYLEGLGCPLD